jgi:UDP-glucose 4-epimerase
MIAVTGGSGFIGSHIVDKLIEKGYDVGVIDVKHPHRNDVKHLKTDVLNREELVKATRDVEYIYHLAALANIDDVYRNPVLGVRVNCEGTVNVLEAARKNEVERVLYASTVWVYGGSPGREVDENSPIYPTGHLYTSTKIVSEFFCHDYWKMYGQKFTILRYGIPYGPRGREETVIPIFIKRAISREPIQIFGDGLQYRNFIYVEDLASGNVAALKKVAENKIYNLDGKEKITILDIANMIKKLIGDVKIEFEEGRISEYRGKDVSCELAKKELGWEPVTDFEEGMRRTIEWYRKGR